MSVRKLLLVGLFMAVGMEAALLSHIIDRVLELRGLQLEVATLFQQSRELFLSLQQIADQTYAVKVHILSEAELLFREVSCCGDEWAAFSDAVMLENGSAQVARAYQALNDAVYAHANGEYERILETIRANEFLPYYAIAATASVVGLAFLFVLKTILSPITRLTEAVEAVGLGDRFIFSHKFFEPSEIVSIGTVFEKLLAQLRHELTRREDEINELQQAARRDAEAKEEHLSKIIAASSSPIFILDVAGNVTTWNKAMSSLTQIAESEAIGRAFTVDFLWVSDRPVFQSEIEKVRNNESSSPIQVKVQGRGSQPVTLVVTITAVSDGVNEVSGFTCLGQVVEDFFKERAAALELQQVNEFSSLAASAAHQVNQPLQKIRLYLANAKNRLRVKNLDAEGLKDKLYGADTQLTRVAAIMDQLRDVGRVIEPVSGGFELRRVLERCIELINPGCKESGISVESDIALANERVSGHPLSLEKALLACLTNASDAIKLNDVATGKIQIQALITGEGAAKITIKDNGGGIEGALLDKLFDPFFTTYTDDQHLGLGLTISRAHVQQTGGMINVQSYEDGATVTLFYPASALLSEDHLVAYGHDPEVLE